MWITSLRVELKSNFTGCSTSESLLLIMNAETLKHCCHKQFGTTKAVISYFYISDVTQRATAEQDGYGDDEYELGTFEIKYHSYT